jgi:hypothetical protein
VATSGTISTTVFKTRKVIDQAYRRCRLPTQSITGEMIESAKDELFLMLSAWLNKALPLWCQTKYILGLTEGVYSMELPLGIIDILDANIVTSTRHVDGVATSTSGAADNAFDDDFDTMCTLVAPGDQNITVQLNEAMALTVAGVLPGTSGTFDVALQYSEDGVAWTTFYSNVAEVFVDSEWLWLNVQGIPSVTYYRLVVDSLTLPFSVRELYLGNQLNEINMARINKDDYFYLPDKNARGRPVQFWLDRQTLHCVMNIWPATGHEFRYAQINLLAARHIQDVGTLNQELEIPQRWYDAVVAGLAARLALVTPEVKMDMIEFTKEEANEALALAFAEERDRSPINVNIDISPYTA